MLGGKNREPLGYTIVEVLIVLAVSGLLFVMAANFISGRQGKTAFNQGVNEMTSRLQGMVNDVSDGNYSDLPASCAFNGTNTVTNSGGAGPPHGENPQCVFLGKLIHFTGKIPTHTYEILSVAGGRLDTAGKPIVNLNGPNNADPKVLADYVIIKSDVPQQLEVKKVLVNDGSGNVESYAFGFFQTQGSFDSKGRVASGSQSLQIYFLNSNDVGPSQDAFRIRTLYDLDDSGQGKITKAQSATVCIEDGQRFARIQIGADGSDSRPTVKAYMKDTPC